ncbi:aminotransferase class V-fold PLP-dependent enzyme [Ancylobacter mangrovi]|uniref:aminotransferase class V-fold PLP-dependent enzyme n=1 Tax=Ancylobacter mangrovi TaxID=2972472 RepID=UPI0021620399|nr:aminotransferase class V-fold PLP-dependent enzyme [Ancylobacter mangrovi]MCS0505134.1 aminotransferase class V-fold PLP-dependent enzyme [Ancylobacter mangrovi]
MSRSTIRAIAERSEASSNASVGACRGFRERTDYLRLELAEALREALAESGLNQTQGARACGTDQPSLSRVLRGQLSGVSSEQLVRWLGALGKDVRIEVGSRNAVKSPLAGSREIYLDAHATTRVDPRVADRVQQVLLHEFGNPNSSDHRYGEIAAQILHRAGDDVAQLVGASPEDVRFTGSATEALRLVIGLEMAATRESFSVAASRIEHPAVIDLLNAAERAGYLSVDWVDCDADGVVAISSIADALKRRPALLFLMAANNEVGTIQPIKEAAILARSANVGLVVDASQAAGRIPLDVEATGIDYLILSSHKLYGPKGAGALIGASVRDVASPFPLEAHGPTPNTGSIAGFGEACRIRGEEMAVDEPRIAGLRDRLMAKLLVSVPDLAINGHLGSRLAGNLHVSAVGAPNDQVVAALRGKVSISTGAACASGVDAPSHVLRAMGLPAWRQESALRIGVGKFNTLEDIELAGDAIAQAISSVRQG